MATCPICDHRTLSSATETTTGVCAICAKAAGVRPLPPSRRPPAPCQRCNRTSFVRAVPRLSDLERMSPLFVTVAGLRVAKPWVGDAEVSRGAGRGVLELYICRACGFVEWYCQEPGELPIGPEYMTELVEYDSPAPYR